MVRDVETISFNSEFDVVYFYKNLLCYSQHLELLAGLQVADFSIGMLCCGFVEAGLLDELGLSDGDQELRRLRSRNGWEPEETGKSKAIVFGERKETERFYVRNLGKLLRPFTRVCDKQIVDMVFYVYRKSGVSHFEMLFDVFGGSKDLLIELHLLVARGAKCRPFDLRALKEMLAVAGPEEEPSTGEAKAETGEQGDACVGGFPDAGEPRPSTPAYRPGMGPAGHLEAARKLLLAVENKEQDFFIDNVSTYLSLKFDRELFLIYVDGFKSRHKGNAFYRSLCKFYQCPFFLFEGAGIKQLLVEGHNAVESVDSRLLCFGDNPSASDEGDYRVYKHPVVCNCYTLREFIYMAEETYSSCTSPAENYLLLAEFLPRFVKAFPHRAMARLLRGLLQSRAQFYAKEVTVYLLRGIEELMLIYSDDSINTGSEDDTEVLISEELRMRWTYCHRADKQHGSAVETDKQHGSAVETDKQHSSAVETEVVKQERNSSEESDGAAGAAGQGDGTAGTSIELNKGDDGCSNKNITDMIDALLELSDDELANCFNNAEQFALLDKALAYHFLDSYSDAADAKALLNGLILEAAEEPSLKIHILKHLAILKVVDKETREGVVARLVCIENSTWRYRALLVLQKRLLIELGVSEDWFEETFAKDSVYFVRQLAR